MLFEKRLTLAFFCSRSTWSSIIFPKSEIKFVFINHKASIFYKRAFQNPDRDDEACEEIRFYEKKYWSRCLSG